MRVAGLPDAVRRLRAGTVLALIHRRRTAVLPLVAVVGASALALAVADVIAAPPGGEADPLGLVLAGLAPAAVVARFGVAGILGVAGACQSSVA